MAKKQYGVVTSLRAALPRSKRRRDTPQAGAGGGTVNVVSTGGSQCDEHTHSNKVVLDAQSMDDKGYLYLRHRDEIAESSITEKVKAGYADDAAHADEAGNADKWDQRHFEDFLDQPVRRTDSVKHAEVITGSLRSAGQFVDGINGGGYRLWVDDNNLVHLTLDKLTVRQTMVVFEMLIERIRSVGGQIVVSGANGKVETIETQGDNYRISFEQDNMFLAHDLMRCQVFTGNGVKFYWVEVASVEENAVIVPIEEFEGIRPEVGDECVLMGNTEDVKRQNFILISATEDGKPRIDVMNGVNSKDLTGCLRARFGNLDGVSDDLFPADKQPQGDGLYCDNVFLRGTFLLETGEELKTKFEVMEGKITSAVTGLRQDFLGENGYLSNAGFADGMDKWNTINEAVFFLVGNKWVWANNNVLAKKGNCAYVTTDNGRVVVRINNKYILQEYGNLRAVPTMATTTEGLKTPLPVYLSFFYRCAKPGTLSVCFENVDKTDSVEFESFNINEELEATSDYKQYTCNGLWNGTGDFKLSFTGEIYLYMLVLSTDKVEALTYQYRTLFEQSEKLVNIAAQNFDKDGRVLAESGLMVKSTEAGIYAQDVDGQIAMIGALVETVTETGEKRSVVKLTGDRIQLEGVITGGGNFKVLPDGTIEANNGKFTGEINADSGKIGGFSIVDGSIIADGAIMDLGTDDMRVRFQAVSNQSKSIKMNGGMYEYAEVSYDIKYNENRRVTIPEVSSADFKNFYVADVMDINYYKKFQSTNIGRYGYQYAMLGNGHICLDGIVEGHCLDVISPFTANNQVYMLHLPKFCNRICVKSEFDNCVLVLPDMTTMYTLIGCGFVRPESTRIFSFRLTLINSGEKNIHVAGFSFNEINGGTPLADAHFPQLYTGDGNWITDLTEVYVPKRTAREFMLVVDGSSYSAYEMIN